MKIDEFLSLSEEKLSIPEETVKNTLNLISEIRAFLRTPIDKFNLDDELVKISAYFHSLSELLPEYNRYRDMYHEHVKNVWSELDEEVRLQYEANGKKATEKMVENEILRNDIYRNCKKIYLKFKYLAEVIEVLLNSFKLRKSNIDLLAQLYAQGYWTMLSKAPKSEVIEKKKLEELDKLLDKIQKGDEEVFEE